MLESSAAPFAQPAGSLTQWPRHSGRPIDLRSPEGAAGALPRQDDKERNRRKLDEDREGDETSDRDVVHVSHQGASKKPGDAVGGIEQAVPRATPLGRDERSIRRPVRRLLKRQIYTARTLPTLFIVQFYSFLGRRHREDAGDET
jgi:hypothetical protein